ncbi:unnamed protein product [Boreogadus saida]
MVPVVQLRSLKFCLSSRLEPGTLQKIDRYNPPHRTDQTHLQPLSNHVDCYKAAGMKADVPSGPDRRTEWGRCRSYVGSSSWHCSLSGGIVLFVSPLVEGYCYWFFLC